MAQSRHGTTAADPGFASLAPSDPQACGRGRAARRRLAAAALLALAVLTRLAAPVPVEAAEGAPYPPSPLLGSLSLDWGTLKRAADGSDIWPTTWAADGDVYAPFGDGGGFGDDSERLAYVGVGVARLRGTTAQSVVGQNVISGLNPTLAKCFPLLPTTWQDRRAPQPGHTNPCRLVSINAKAFSALAVNNNLYLTLARGSGFNSMKREVTFYRAPIGTNSWQRASWSLKYTDAGAITPPIFLQAARGYSGVGDYVYAYAARLSPVGTAPPQYWVHRDGQGGRIVLMRAPKNSDLLARGNWQFYAGSPGGSPAWTGNLAAAQPVFTDPNGVGMSNSSIYIAPLKRYLLLTHHSQPATGKFGIFEAPNPWGEWRTVFYGTIANTAAGVPAAGFTINILPSSVSSDGKRFTLVLSGKGVLDSINLVDGSFR